MKRVAILTDFVNYDPAYSLCQVVRCQLKMLRRAGYEARLIVRQGFNDVQEVPLILGNGYQLWGGQLSELCEDIVPLDHGQPADNTVRVTPHSEMAIVSLVDQLGDALRDVDVVLTHDLIYQPAQWLCHVASRRYAAQHPETRWLHWVHSATALNTADRTGVYRDELRGAFPNSRLVVMHGEELSRKAGAFGYEVDGTVIIPNPLDLTEYFHPAVQQAVDKWGLMLADCILVYPCRLDRGKQPGIVIEVAAALQASGIDTRAVIVDFHSVGGDKADFRAELRKLAAQTGAHLFFTSDLDGAEPGYPWGYALPHKAALDLMTLADVLVHPSTSESDSSILAEAMWARAGLVLNFDLPPFRQHDGHALFYKFSSGIDVNTGQPGNTTTSYSDRDAYMRGVAAGIAYLLRNNPVLNRRVWVRQTKSLEAAWRPLWAAIEAS